MRAVADDFNRESFHVFLTFTPTDVSYLASKDVGKVEASSFKRKCQGPRCLRAISRLPCQKEGGYRPGICLVRLATDGRLSPTDTGLKLIDKAHVPSGHLPGLL